jgi:hypothetical protein
MRQSTNHETVAGELINNSASRETTLRLGKPEMRGVGPKVRQLNVAHVVAATATTRRRRRRRLLSLVLYIRHNSSRGVTSVETRESNSLFRTP